MIPPRKSLDSCVRRTAVLARYKSFFPRLLVEALQCALPVLPVKDVISAGHFIRSEQGREGLLTGFRPDSAKAEGEDELAVAGGQVNLSGQRDVSVPARSYSHII